MLDPYLYVVLMERDFVASIVRAILRERFPTCKFVGSIDELPSPSNRVLQFSDGLRFSFEHVLAYPETSLLNSYSCNSALTRKSHLAQTVAHWIRKSPSSILRDRVPETIKFEVDYAEYLDQALVEAFEIRQSFQTNESLEPSEYEWWILKPDLTDGGYGQALFSTADQLREIFNTVYTDEPDDSDPEHVAIDGDSQIAQCKIYTSRLREFVAQRYIDPPLLCDGRKFHIRTYVLAVGWLKVFVSREMLCLFAQEPYCSPSTSRALEKHLTNTALHGGLKAGLKQSFWSLSLEMPDKDELDWKKQCFKDICRIVADVFEGAARTHPAHFQMLPNTFELYGLDFLLDRCGDPWLLEVNCRPAFYQGSSNLDKITKELFSNVVELAVCGFFNPEEHSMARCDGMEEVLDIDLAVR